MIATRSTVIAGSPWSVPLRDDLEVLRLDVGVAVAGLVVLLPVLRQLVVQRRPAVFVQRGEGLLRRTEGIGARTCR